MVKMVDLSGNYCKLCIISITGKDFKLKVNAAKDMLTFLSLKVTLDDNSVLCGNCSKKLFAAFDFKSTCTYTDSIISLYIDNSRTRQLDLRQVHMIENGNNICRLCLQTLKNNFTLMCEVDQDLLKKYIPNMKSDYVKDPVICALCVQSLTVHSEFLRQYAQPEKGFCDTSALQIEDVEIKFEETEPEKGLCVKIEEDQIKFEECDLKNVMSECTKTEMEETEYL